MREVDNLSEVALYSVEDSTRFRRNKRPAHPCNAGAQRPSASEAGTCSVLGNDGPVFGLSRPMRKSPLGGLLRIDGSQMRQCPPRDRYVWLERNRRISRNETIPFRKCRKKGPTKQPPTVSGVSQPAGRPRSHEADQAILSATLQSLSDVGFAKTTMSGIARRAGVSSATLYRRYQNLDDVIVAAVAQLVDDQPVPDSGSLIEDLRGYLTTLAEWLAGDIGTRLLPALLDEAHRNPTLAQAIRTFVGGPARAELTIMFKRAIDRGEMRPDIDLDLLIDMSTGPLYIRRVGPGRPIPPGMADELADLIVTAVTTTPTRRANKNA